MNFLSNLNANYSTTQYITSNDFFYVQFFNVVDRQWQNLHVYIKWNILTRCNIIWCTSSYNWLSKFTYALNIFKIWHFIYKNLEKIRFSNIQSFHSSILDNSGKSIVQMMWPHLIIINCLLLFVGVCGVDRLRYSQLSLR